MTFGFGVGIQRLGSVGVPTLAALNALPAPGAGIRPTGLVYADPTVSNNGVYTWNGSAWSKARALPDQVAKLTVTGGTANAITATAQAGVDPATTLMVLLTPSATNTGAVTLNGKAVKSRAGADLISGALTAGALYALVDLGTEYRVFLNNFADIADIAGLQAALDAKANAAAVAAALDGKSNVGHGHAISDVSGLSTALDAKSDKTITVTGAGLATGGGDLSGNRVITVTKATDAEAQARTRDDVAVSPKGVGLAVVAYNRFETIRDVDLAGLTAVNIADLSAFRILHITGSMKPSVSGAFLWAQGSVDNGATWLSGIYTNHFFRAVETGTGAGLAGAEAGFYIASDVSNAWEAGFDHTLTNFNKVSSKYKGGWMAYVSSAGNNTAGLVIGRTGTSNSAAWNALRLFISSGTISNGSLHVEGIRG